MSEYGDDLLWADEDKEREQGTRWRARGDTQFVTHYEFYAVIDPMNAKLLYLRNQIGDIEERLVETRAKHFLVDLFVTGTGRFILVAASLIAAFVASKLGYGPFG